MKVAFACQHDFVEMAPQNITFGTDWIFIKERNPSQLKYNSQTA